MDRRVGYIVGEVETNSFWFVSDLESFPPRHEYLVIEPSAQSGVAR